MEKPTRNASATPAATLGFTADERALLQLLLAGKPAQEFLRARHRMPAVVADAINEKLFGEIGDSVLECDGDTVTLLSDYAADVRALLASESLPL